MKTSIVNNKGQVVIPSDLRKKFRIEKGTKIFFSEDGDEIRLLTMARMIESNFGFMKTREKLLKEYFIFWENYIGFGGKRTPPTIYYLYHR